jgi:hypothetical protein
VIERIVLYIIGGTVALTVLAAVLPKLVPSLVILALVTVIGRLVWWRTR